MDTGQLARRTSLAEKDREHGSICATPCHDQDLRNLLANIPRELLHRGCGSKCTGQVTHNFGAASDSETWVENCCAERRRQHRLRTNKNETDAIHTMLRLRHRTQSSHPPLRVAPSRHNVFVTPSLRPSTANHVSEDSKTENACGSIQRTRRQHPLCKNN